jgi:hypothetical protein
MDRLDRIEAILDKLTERHDRLTERHEALAQSLEILTHDVQELRTATETDAKNILALANAARDALTSIQSLERIATAHQESLDEHGERIRRLEDQGPQ